MSLEDKVRPTLKARPTKGNSEHESKGLERIKGRNEMSLEEIRSCLMVIKGHKVNNTEDSFDKSLLALKQTFSSSVISTNSSDVLIKRYLALALDIAKLYKLSPKQTVLLIQSNLVGGLEDVVSIMADFGLELNFLIKFFMALVVKDTKLKEMQNFYENYEPRGNLIPKLHLLNKN